jgi:pantoate--beta-alanine ligase
VNTIRTVSELREELAPERAAGRRIGLVPTMGAFHEGHLSLMRRAREDCDVVVVSLFVNPSQFDEQADLAAYPRDEAADAQLAAAEGVDYLFVPSADEVYPRGFATTVSLAGATARLEGAQRGTSHFDGVTTVVTKLLNMVGPDAAYFGQKDAQQAAVVGRLVRDLDIPVELMICPTVREPDGLAMSSRNARLSAVERRRATALYRALRRAQETVAAGERVAAIVTREAVEELQRDVEPEYFELVHPETFAPVAGRLDDGEVLAVVAARVGATRLIDNHMIHVPSTDDPEGAARSATHQSAGSTPTQEALACSERC